MKKQHPVLSKLIALTLLFSLLFHILPAAKAASELPFRDVKEGKWYYKAVVWAYKNGITTGTSSDSFSPKRELSYAETATFLHRYAYSPKAHYIYAKQLQNDQNKYYYKSLSWACDFDIIQIGDVSGTENTPTQKLTRNDFVRIMFRYALNWEHRSVACSDDYLARFEDAPADAKNRTAWNWAINAGIIAGTSSSTLSPEKYLNRAEFVTMLYRYENQDEPLRGEALYEARLRGWQRTLLETLELAYGVEYQNHAYEIGSDGIPLKIDCSGIIEWAFCASGIYNVPDLESFELWASNHFTRTATREASGGSYAETGYQFINRVRSDMQPGDMIFCGFNDSNYHMMVYIGASSSYLYVFHSRLSKDACVERIPNTPDSYYLRNIYGIKRYIP